VIIEINFLSKHGAFRINQKENRLNLFGFFLCTHGIKCKDRGWERKISASSCQVFWGYFLEYFFIVERPNIFICPMIVVSIKSCS